MLDCLKKIIFAVEGRFFGGVRLNKPVFNCFHRDPASRKRALLVYRALPFHLERGHPALRYHQSLKQALQIATVLDEFGYTVDVVDIVDRKFQAEATYDLVINHRVDYAGLEKAFGPRTIKVYLASGTNHVVHNSNQALRARYYAERKGRQPTGLVWDKEEMPFLKIADAMAGFGNKFTTGSWRSAFPKRIYDFNNYSFPELKPVPRNWEEARSNFLFLGSRQQLGKGLDLLLDAFSQCSDLHLYICSKYQDEPDFCEVYRKELFHSSNIHPCGWVDIGGPKFRRLVTRCGYVILPSCSEGSPGSIINAMGTGMVPIVTKEAGVDTDDFGFCLPDFRVETISETVRTASQMPPEELALRSRKALEAVAEQFSQDAFIKRWRQIISDIIETFEKQSDHGDTV